MTMPRKYTYLIVVLTVLIAGACSVKQEVFISADASGTVTINIDLADALTEYLLDLAEVTGQSFDQGFFDLTEIKRSFQENESARLISIVSPRPESLAMEIAYNSIAEVFSSKKEFQEAGILSLSKGYEATTLRLKLNRSNFKQISQLFPMLDNPLFQGLGPQENDDTTEEEYIELIELAMGEEGALALQKSFLETTIKIKGTLISQSGGTVTGDGVVFKIPLIRILLLDKPLEYSLVFR